MEYQLLYPLLFLLIFTNLSRYLPRSRKIRLDLNKIMSSTCPNYFSIFLLYRGISINFDVDCLNCGNCACSLLNQFAI